MHRELTDRVLALGAWGRSGALAFSLALGSLTSACSLQAPDEGSLFGMDAGTGRRDSGMDARASSDASSTFDPSEGLVLHYRFDESNGGIAHDFVGSGDGIVYGEPRWVRTGRIAGALELVGASGVDGGAGSFVELPQGVLASLEECTIATWFNWSARDSWERVFDFGHGAPVWIYFTPGDALGMPRLAGRLPEPLGPEGVFVELPLMQPIRAGTWTHLAVTWTSERIAVYLDGRRAGDTTPEGVVAADLGNTARNWIGRSQFQPGEHPEGFVDPDFAGMVDEFRIYDRALSAREIAELYALD